MALQGTLDAFPLPDVLALLSSSSKSGRLELTGDRGSGLMWIHDGCVAGGGTENSGDLDPSRLVFELLRFNEGSFEFSSVDPELVPAVGHEPVPVADALAAAGQMLEEWAAIESVVPSPEHVISLTPELPVSTLTVDAELWSTIVAVSGGSTVRELAKSLQVDIYQASAVVASLVGEGLGSVSEPALETSSDHVAADDWSANDVADISEPHTISEDLRQEESMWEQADTAFPDHFPIDDLVDSDSGDVEGWGGVSGSRLDQSVSQDSNLATDISFSSLPNVGATSTSGDAGAGSFGSGLGGWDAMVESDLLGAGSPPALGDASDPADEVLRQMSKLSPKAAEAIAAALGGASESPMAPEAGLDGEPSESGPVSFLDSF